MIDPYEETPQHVAEILKMDLRLRLDGLIDGNLKSSQSKSSQRLQSILESTRSDSAKGTSVQSFSEKLDKYRVILNELDVMIDSGNENLGPIGEYS